MISLQEKRALQLCVESLGAVEPKKDFATPGNPNHGKCYLASIALLQFLGGKEKGYKLCKANDAFNVPHYWVQNSDGLVLDATADQYEILDSSPPYEDGKGIGYRGNIKAHKPILLQMNEAAKNQDW